MTIFDELPSVDFVDHVALQSIQYETDFT